jgi:hypothetical protein
VVAKTEASFRDWGPRVRIRLPPAWSPRHWVAYQIQRLAQDLAHIAFGWGDSMFVTRYSSRGAANGGQSRRYGLIERDLVTRQAREG